MPQTYSPDDDVAHLRWLAEVFADPRYLRIDGKPVFLVYRAFQLPDPVATTDRWRAEAARLGLGELYLCSLQTGPGERHPPATLGFDAAVQFAPFYGLPPDGKVQRVSKAAARRLGMTTRSTRFRIIDYDAVVEQHLAAEPVDYTRYPCVSPGFDNSPRRPERGATIITGGTPERYERWLRDGDRTLPSAVGGGEPRLRQRVERVGGGEPPRARSTVGPRLPRRARAAVVRRGEQPMTAPSDAAAARVIALYLPQFHPIPENDEWWGPGFTEWTNVAARPAAASPGTTSRSSRARSASTTCASPRRARRRPSSPPRTASARSATGTTGSPVAGCSSSRSTRCSRSGEPDFPFCLGWANQNWSTIWTGGNRVLVEQTYPGPDDHARHFDAVLPAFEDPRYLRVDGRPLFFVYRPSDLPGARAFADQWRGLAERAGLPGLYLVGETKGGWTAAASGFDAELHSAAVRGGPAPDQRSRRRPDRTVAVAAAPCSVRHDSRVGRRPTLPHPRLPVVLSNWDNTPALRHPRVRPDRGDAGGVRSQRCAARSTPCASSRPTQRIVFLKSWNEWAEGNYVEPDRQHGTAYLREVAAAVRGEPALGPPR